MAVGSASATNISYYGGYSLSDLDLDGFSETLDLNQNAISLPGYPTGVAFVSNCNPLDPVFADFGIEYIMFGTSFQLDPSSYVSGSKYNINPTNYTDAFSLYDHNHTKLLEADVNFASLYVDNTVGYINSSFSVNLANITAGGGYFGSSIIIDSFLSAIGGAASVTLQFDKDMSACIENGTLASGTYSGIAAAPVPEPTTIALLGLSLVLGSGFMKRLIV